MASSSVATPKLYSAPGGRSKMSSPADFLHLQSLRSSALAHKSATGSRYGAQSNADLFDTLMASVKPNTTVKVGHVAASPLDQLCDDTLKLKIGKDEDADSGAFLESDASKESVLIERGPVHYVSSHGSRQASAPYYRRPAALQHSAWSQSPRTSTDSSCDHSSLTSNQELPEFLSDFILKYSRCYTVEPTTSAKAPVAVRKGSDGLGSTASPPGRHSDDDDAESRASANTAGSGSPDTPDGARLPSTAYKWTVRQMPVEWRAGVMLTGRERVRSKVGERERDEDLAKTYALVEQMLKNESPTTRAPFDTLNKQHETPLMLAAEKGNADAVAYLLEVGADPNTINRRPEQDGALHIAASRGLEEVVDLLCAHTSTDVDLRNGMGQTPLLRAGYSHRVIGAEGGKPVNTLDTLRALLRSGASATLVDDTDGKSIMHVAVERMEPRIIEVCAEFMDRPALRALVRLTDKNGEKPLATLKRLITEGTGLYTPRTFDANLARSIIALLVAAEEADPAATDN